MKKTKSALLGLLLATSITSLQGCKKNAFPDFVMPEGGYDNSEVEIKFYTTMNQTLLQVLDIYVKEFNEIYPNITVTVNSIGGYDDIRGQMSTELAMGAQKQASLVYCYPDHVALYNKANSVCPLDDLMNDTKYGLGLTQAQKDDFVQAYYNEGSQFGDGKMYCLPFSRSTEVLYYNKTFFDENNLAVPTTWDEMEEICKKIKTEIDPDCYPLGYDSDSNLFITMAEQLGSGYTSSTEPHFLFNNQENKDMVARIKEWYDSGLMTTKGMYGQYTSSLFTALPPTKEGEKYVRSYMSIGSSAGAGNQVPALVNKKPYFEVGIAPMPQFDRENHPAVISQGPSICIYKSENPQEVIASWLFTRHLLTSAAFQGEFSINSGYVPVINSVYDTDNYKEFMAEANGFDGIEALSAKMCLEQSDLYFTSPAFFGSSEARDEVGNLLDAVLSGKKSIDEAFQEAYDNCVDASIV